MPQLHGSLRAVLLASSQKGKNTKKKSPVGRSKKTELEEIQRRATKMSKFLDFSVNWDARSTLEKREMRGIRQKSVNC